MQKIHMKKSRKMWGKNSRKMFKIDLVMHDVIKSVLLKESTKGMANAHWSRLKRSCSEIIFGRFLV